MNWGLFAKIKKVAEPSRPSWILPGRPLEEMKTPETCLHLHFYTSPLLYCRWKCIISWPEEIPRSESTLFRNVFSTPRVVGNSTCFAIVCWLFSSNNYFRNVIRPSANVLCPDQDWRSGYKLQILKADNISVKRVFLSDIVRPYGSNAVLTLTQTCVLAGGSDIIIIGSRREKSFANIRADWSGHLVFIFGKYHIWPYLNLLQAKFQNSS